MLNKPMLVISVSILSLWSFQPAFAQISNVEMQVDGMTCPFCVYGIEKKLKAVGEVMGASANLKTGIVDIKLKKNAPLDIERLNKAIHESGFTPGKIKIKATGELTKYKLGSNENAALRVTGSNQVFLLTLAPDHEKEEFLSDKKSNEVEKATEGGKKEITITGYVHSHPSGIPLALCVESSESK
jgi:copper chaperone CopZ